MDWIYSQEPILGVPLLVQYIQGSYEVLEFKLDNEYGLCAATFESYVGVEHIYRWCIIA